MKKLELGCGKVPMPGYLHQDITRQEGVELDFICQPWEIDLPANSLDEVIALAMMEHLRFEDFNKTQDHVFNLLEPRGEFLFDVPDMKIWSEYLYNLTHGKQYLNPFPEYHIWATIYGWQRWPGDEHKSGWIKENLYNILKETGYHEIIEGVQIFTEKGIQRRRFNRLGDAHIYIKAIK